MKCLLSLFTVILLSVGLLTGMSPPTPVQSYSSVSNQSVSDQSVSSVWKISKDDNYLFLGGSIHILRPDDFPLPRSFDRAFSKSVLLVLEADIEQMADETVAEYMMSRMYLPEGKTLQSILEPDTYDLLEAECLEYGFPIEAVSNLKPSMVMTVLSVFQMQKFGFVEQGVDTFYLNQARKENKPVRFLESVELQIDMLVSMGEGYENEYVLYSLEDFSTTDNSLAELVAEWKAGDASLTKATLTSMREEWPEIYKSMVLDRNAAWMPQIEDFLSSGATPLIIVGAAHLHGPDGLLTQLANSGCTVEQL
jgi:uncharacterized protein YbaP (TraB family)